MDLQTKTYRLFDIYPELAREYAKRLHKKKEDIPYTQKFYSSSKAEASEEERTIVSYISTSDVDRDGEVLLPKGMSTKHYESSGKPVFWGHRYDEPKDVIGQCQWLKVDAGGTGVVAKTAFRNTEFADEVYQLYSEDLTGQGPILRGFSVGFIPLEWETGKKEGDPRRTYTKWELLEFSFVSIPCNPMAQTIIGQKGIKLCDKLRRDLGLDAVAEPTAIEPETKEGGDVEQTVTVTGKSEYVLPGDVQISDNLDRFSSAEPNAKQKHYRILECPQCGRQFEENMMDPGQGELLDVTCTECGAFVSLTENMWKPKSAVAPEAKDEAAPAPDLGAMLQAIVTRLDGIEARLAPAPAPVVTIEPVAITPPADFITLDPEPDILAGIEAAPAPAQAPKSIETMTEDEVIAAVGKAIDGLDITAQIKELVDLELDRLRGRVR
jgi:hypothetical protein